MQDTTTAATQVESSSTSSSQLEFNRTGRKGDPRMHKAVAARLEHPKISLFQAIVKGGFEYDQEDDPNSVDSEGVTLGQRKNQLSRRLRLTKKQPSSKRKSDDLLSDDPAAQWNGSVGSSPRDTDATPRMARDHPQFKQLLIRHGLKSTEHAQHDQASGVAVAQLSHIASTVGMTLEQLAIALGNHRNLAQALKGTSGRQKLALAFYNSGARKLRTDCMLQAGYPREIAEDETSDDFQEFAMAAWKQEGDFIKKQQEDTSDANWKDPPLDPPMGLSAKRQRSSSCANERHMHRLEGRCGHQAILHQPANGPAHIDFVIGDRVECFQGVQPLLPPNTNEANVRVWPSKYKCQELKCTDSCPNEKATEGQHDHDEFMTAPEPKILDLNDIDMGGGEWNMDFANDSSLLGLFKLGNATETTEKTPVYESHGTTDGDESSDCGQGAKGGLKDR